MFGKEDVLSIIRDNQDKIKTFGVKKLGLFGSFVRKEQTVQSDIDLLVEFYRDKKTFDNFVHLSFLLEDLLKQRIELVTNESLSPYIKPNIMREVEYVISRN
ncbi:MAG: nucleotidyltransferase family protein [Candidatus Omnitrophota bacterium]